MNILVQGAGALGAYFGGRMLEAGQHISFFVREKRAQQLEKEGLKIISPEGDFSTKELKIYTSVEEVKDIDLLILAIKGYHLKEALPQVEKIVKQNNAFVLPLLNGIEHMELLQNTVGKEKVLGGFAAIIATLNEQGHVIHTSKGSMMKFGPLHDSQLEICDQLEAIHTQVKTRIIREEEILKHMWIKYIFITAFAGITSATQLPAGFISKHEAVYRVVKNIVHEMCMLAEKEGIVLAEEEAERIAERVKNHHKEATSSMHQDLRKGLPIEVEHLQGGALRLAEKHDLKLPVVETIYGILKPYEFGQPD